MYYEIAKTDKNKPVLISKTRIKIGHRGKPYPIPFAHKVFPHTLIAMHDHRPDLLPGYRNQILRCYSEAEFDYEEAARAKRDEARMAEHDKACEAFIEPLTEVELQEHFELVAASLQDDLGREPLWDDDNDEFEDYGDCG